MSKFYIKTTDSTAIITGDTMVMDDTHLYVYSTDTLGREELRGMFKKEAVIDAHRTDKE